MWYSKHNWMVSLTESIWDSDLYLSFKKLNAAGAKCNTKLRCKKEFTRWGLKIIPVSVFQKLWVCVIEGLESNFSTIKSDVSNVNWSVVQCQRAVLHLYLHLMAILMMSPKESQFVRGWGVLWNSRNELF